MRMIWTQKGLATELLARTGVEGIRIINNSQVEEPKVFGIFLDLGPSDRYHGGPHTLAPVRPGSQRGSIPKVVQALEDLGFIPNGDSGSWWQPGTGGGAS